MGVTRLLSVGVAALLLSAGLAAAPAPAKEAKPNVWDRGCGDDDGNDRCNEQVQREMLVLYGLEPAERLARSGRTLRRVMYVDGYGRDLLAISFIRNADGKAMVELRLPCAAKPDCAVPLRARAKAGMWASVARPPEGLANGKPKPDETRICLHAWVVVVEAAGPGLRNSPVRAAESACSRGPAAPYALALAKQALTALPECALLGPDNFRNEPSLLATCAWLRGDRRAASEVYLLARDLTRGGTGPEGGTSRLFSRPAKERAAALDEALADANLQFDRVEGLDRNHVRVTGKLFYHTDSEDKNLVVELALDYVREGGRFVIADYRLGQRVVHSPK